MATQLRLVLFEPCSTLVLLAEGNGACVYWCALKVRQLCQIITELLVKLIQKSVAVFDVCSLLKEVLSQHLVEHVVMSKIVVLLWVGCPFLDVLETNGFFVVNVVQIVVILSMERSWSIIPPVIAPVMVVLLRQVLHRHRTSQFEVVNDSFSEQFEVNLAAFAHDPTCKALFQHCIVGSDLDVFADQGLNLGCGELWPAVFLQNLVLVRVANGFHFLAHLKRLSGITVNLFLEALPLF